MIDGSWNRAYDIDLATCMSEGDRPFVTPDINPTLTHYLVLDRHVLTFLQFAN